ncbi:MAG: methyltransferase domain-containing protein [Candidatus Cloacimonetes bacterium]|nr:methyltransferase domain-containing protein [Candidatus Cloacimonadota bacterium]
MQAYRNSFAEVYDRKWNEFSDVVAPLICDYFEEKGQGLQKRLLDVGCGTGRLAKYFCNEGFRVIGIDRSESMLEHARESCKPFVDSGKAEFIAADAAGFSMRQTFPLITATYDMLNHLEDIDKLRGCFFSVYRLMEREGMFIFDMNTEKGLRQGWHSHSIREDKESLIIMSSYYDEEIKRAWLKNHGFIKQDNGLYMRFEEVVYNTMFPLSTVRSLLMECGFNQIHFARIGDLETPLPEPENEHRVFCVARI